MNGGVDAGVFASVLTIMVLSILAALGFSHRRISSLEEAHSDRMDRLEDRVAKHELAVEQRLGLLATRQDLRIMYEDFKRDQKEQLERFLEVVQRDSKLTPVRNSR